MAYGVAVYIRIINNNNEIYVSLGSAKSKVAPIEKEICIPRLELCGAVLAAKLIFEIGITSNEHTEGKLVCMVRFYNSFSLAERREAGLPRVRNRVSEIVNIL